MIITRRSLLGSLGATLIVAPSIVRATSLMPVHSMDDVRLWASFLHPNFNQWMFAPLDTLPVLDSISGIGCAVKPMGPSFSRMMNDWQKFPRVMNELERISLYPISIEHVISMYGSVVHHALRDRTL